MSIRHKFRLGMSSMNKYDKARPDIVRHWSRTRTQCKAIDSSFLFLFFYLLVGSRLSVNKSKREYSGGERERELNRHKGPFHWTVRPVYCVVDSSSLYILKGAVENSGDDHPVCWTGKGEKRICQEGGAVKNWNQKMKERIRQAAATAQSCHTTPPAELKYLLLLLLLQGLLSQSPNNTHQQRWRNFRKQINQICSSSSKKISRLSSMNRTAHVLDSSWNTRLVSSPFLSFCEGGLQETDGINSITTRKKQTLGEWRMASKMIEKSWRLWNSCGDSRVFPSVYNAGFVSSVPAYVNDTLIL